MKIVFNLHRVGLGNNGGSRTIIKSAESLASLGHEVILSIDIKNKYTWEKIGGEVKVLYGNKSPKGDVIIATGYDSVRSTLLSPIKKKFYFIRGFEVWRTTKDNLFKSYKSLRCIVNSSWLQKMLKKRGVKSSLIYNGLDFNDFYNMNVARENPLGALYHKKHKTKNHAFVQKCADIRGTPLLSLNKDIKNPNSTQLNDWYNNINVWISASELEGLHNPPMEASLSGCGLVATDHPRSGVSDYAIHNKTALVYKHGDKTDAMNCIKKLLSDDNTRRELNLNMVELLRTKIGTREKNMIKFLNIIGGQHG